MSDFDNFKSRTVDGAAAGNITVTGVLLGDRLITVQRVDVAGANLVAEFTVTADNTINNTGGTSTAAGKVLVLWEAKGGGRARTADSGQRLNY